MGCCGGEREKFGELKAEQKWEYIVSLAPPVLYTKQNLTDHTEP